MTVPLAGRHAFEYRGRDSGTYPSCPGPEGETFAVPADADLVSLCATVGVLLLALAWVAAAPATGRSRRRAAKRRVRHLVRHPERARRHDLAVTLELDGATPAAAAAALGAADAGQHPVPLLRDWVLAFGAGRLELALQAGYSTARLTDHLAQGVSPDLDELLLFAQLGGRRGGAPQT